MAMAMPETVETKAWMLAGWVIAFLLTLVVGIGGWAINASMANVNAAMLNLDVKITKQQETLNAHLITHPDKELRLELKTLDGRILQLQQRSLDNSERVSKMWEVVNDIQAKERKMK